MSNVWFTSDTHFFHNNIIKLCGRPFANKEEMNETIIKNWNEVVQDIDTVYHLGDFGFCDIKKVDKIRDQLKGNIHFIRGNHDQEIPNTYKGFAWIKDYYELKIDDIFVVLSHYPFLTYNKEHHGAIQLSGHTHSASWLVRPNRRGIHVGVDAWDFKPASWEQIKKRALEIEVKIDVNNL